jgi:hypothetical protein
MPRLARAGHAASMDPQRLAELHASTAQIAAAGRIATALVVGFQLCADARHPLNELQRIELVKAALLVFEDFRSDVESQIRIGTALGSFGADEVGAGGNGAGGKRDAA